MIETSPALGTLQERLNQFRRLYCTPVGVDVLKSQQSQRALALDVLFAIKGEANQRIHQQRPQEDDQSSSSDP